MSFPMVCVYSMYAQQLQVQQFQQISRQRAETESESETVERIRIPLQIFLLHLIIVHYRPTHVFWI